MDKPAPYLTPVPAARAIVIKDKKLLVIRRSKPNGRKYTVIPGGRLESGETPEDAVLREVEEETTLIINNPRLVFIEGPKGSFWGTQHIFLCDYVSGEVVLNPVSEEYAFQELGGGTYEPMWVEFNDIDTPEYPFRSERLFKEIKKVLSEGFPDEPISWNLKRL